MTRALAWLALAGCAGDDGRRRPAGDDDDDTAFEGMLDERTEARSAGGDGRFEVEVDVGEGVTAFQITGESARWVSLEELYDPDGNLVVYWEDWWSSRRSLTDAVFGFTKVTAFDWPVRRVDGPLAEGRWRAVWSLVDDQGYYAPGDAVTVTVSRKKDDDLDAARIAVRISWADGVDQDPAVVAAVGQAVERWREVWAAHGLELVETYAPSELDPALPWAWDGGDPSVAAATADKDPGQLHLVIGERIGSDNFTYGVAAGIPGTIQPTSATYVVVSWLVHAGRDAVFTADETRLMGETMAHEVGHYEGLYHPVESDYRYWDALEDTVECDSARACEDQLGDNLMFPYSICDATSCLPTDRITADQVGVVQRYLGSL